MAEDIDTKLKKNQISILMLTDFTVFLFSNIYFLFPVKPTIIIEVQIINIMELWNKRKKKKTLKGLAVWVNMYGSNTT